jgi:hypothetical protein
LELIPLDFTKNSVVQLIPDNQLSTYVPEKLGGGRDFPNSPVKMVDIMSSFDELSRKSGLTYSWLTTYQEIAPTAIWSGNKALNLGRDSEPKWPSRAATPTAAQRNHR